MRGKRYLTAIVGAVLAVSLGLPGVALAQEEKYAQAFRAYEAQNYAQAETLFREVCAEYQDAGAPWGWCHLMLGVTLVQRGAARRQEALDQLEVAADLVTEDAEHYQVHSSIANIHLLEGRNAQAIAAADEAARYAPPNDNLLPKIKGQAHYFEGDYRQAAAELEKAVAGRTGEANLHAWLGRSYFELGDEAKALEQLSQAAQIDRNNRIGLYFGARIHFANGRYNEAVAMAQRAVQAYPQDTTIRSLYGNALLGAGRYADAIQQFEVVIQERPSDGGTIYNLGQAYMATENWPRAIEQLQKAQNLLQAGSNQQGDLLYDLGMAFEKIGRNEDALRAFRDSVSINETQQKLDAIERVQERIRRKKGGQ